MTEITELLTTEFPGIKFDREESEYGGALHTFYISLETEEALADNWENIRNMIAVYFQTHLEIEFARWNLYLFFITPMIVNRDLKHKVEHDTVSSRKIVVDQHPKQDDASFHKILFCDHISNANLNLDSPQSNIPAFRKDRVLSLILDKLPLVKAKRNDGVFLTALQELEKKLKKNEITKSKNTGVQGI